MSSLGDSLQRSLEPLAGAQQAARLRERITPSRMSTIGCSGSDP